MTLAERLQELRKRSGHSQEQLAEKIGVSRQAVSKWESGQGNPDSNNLIRISEIYEVSTDYILKGTPDPDQLPATEEVTTNRSKKLLVIILLLIGIPLSGVLFLSLLTFFIRLISNL